MKKALLAALFVIIAASWCLAQSDSLPVPTTEDTMTAKPVAIKTAECPDKKWILGFEATSLDLKALPGTVFLQRKISTKFFVGAGFSFHGFNNNPGEDYDADDSTRFTSNSKEWSFTMIPEIGYMALKASNFAGGLSVKASINRNRYTSSSSYRYEMYHYSYSTQEGESNNFNYSISVPVFIEKHFKIKKYPAAVGIANNFVGLSGGWYKYSNKSTYESYWAPIPDIHEDERTIKMPVTFSLDNPFQGNVRVFFKFFM